jgi:hypothetical protein
MTHSPFYSIGWLTSVIKRSGNKMDQYHLENIEKFLEWVLNKDFIVDQRLRARWISNDINPIPNDIKN